MSIASEESEKYFPTEYWPNMEPKGDYRGKECYIEGVKSSDIQEAYERGRTAEPTEAEVDSAVSAWDMHEGCGCIGHPIMCTCGREFSAEHEFYAHVMRCVLEAVRKAVME